MSDMHLMPLSTAISDLLIKGCRMTA